jgi:hypothetical protein
MSLKFTLTTVVLVALSGSISLADDIKGGQQLTRFAKNPTPSKRAKYTVPQNSGDYIKRVDALAEEEKKYQEQLEKDIKAVNISQDSLIEDLSAADAELEGLETKYRETRRLKGSKNSELAKLKAKIDTAKEKRDKSLKLRDKIKENEQAVKNTTDQLDDVNSEAKKIGADFADIQKGLHTQLKLQGITMEYAKLDKYFDNNDNRLEAIANYYDKTVLGAYVQDKITELARSSVLCEATKNCLAGGTQKVSADSVQLELFESSNSSRQHNQPSLNSTKMRGSTGFASPIPAATKEER